MKLRIVLLWMAVNIVGGLIVFAIFDTPLFRGFRFPEYRGAIIRYSALAIFMFLAIGAFQVLVLASIDMLLRGMSRTLRATIVAAVAVLYGVFVPALGLLMFVHAMLVAIPFFLATGLLFGLWLTLTPAAPQPARAATL